MNNPFSAFDAACTALITDSLAALGYGDVDAIMFEEPAGNFGDAAFPCFQLAKQAKKAPQQIAADIAAHCADHRDRHDSVAKVEAVNAYVNFHADARAIAVATLDAVRTEKERYGAGERKDEKIILEHTSANPTGPLHVGRARNPIIGDTLARILRNDGYDVETQYYVDDLGKQVSLLTWGAENVPERFPEELQKLESEESVHDGRADYKLVKYYQIASKLMAERPEVAAEIDEFIMRCERGEADALARAEAQYTLVLDGVKESLATIGVYFNSFVNESCFISDGSVDEIVENLKRTACFGSENGAYFLELGGFGIKGKDTRFFITRSNGTSLYATRDIAYHLWKFRHAAHVINVLGEDHKLEARQIAISLELLGVSRTAEPIFYSFVSLPEGRMSTRRGRVVYLDDLVDESIGRAHAEVSKRRDDISGGEMADIARAVGIGALRYNIIKVQPDKGIVFNWDEALSFDGMSAPFIQYAHARICSIIRRAAVPDSARPDASILTHPSEQLLIKTLAKFPRIAHRCAVARAPHLMAKYAHDVALAFNQFYRDCRIIGEPEERMTARFALAACTKQTISNALNLLGIDALEEM